MRWFVAVILVAVVFSAATRARAESEARVTGTASNAAVLLETERPLRVGDVLGTTSSPRAFVVVDFSRGGVASAHVVGDVPVRVGDALVRARNRRVYSGISRFYVRIRPLVGVHSVGGDPGQADTVGGMVTDVGVEANTRSGFRIGLELAPIAVLSNVLVPSVSARLHLGYANEFIGISFAIGSSLSIIYPQAGPVLRIGRFDGPHANVRVTWSVFPARFVPVDAAIEVNVPVSLRVRFHIDVGGAYGNLLGAYGLVGAQVYLRGDGLSGTTLLTAGAGVAWAQYSLGPAATVGAEHRW